MPGVYPRQNDSANPQARECGGARSGKVLSSAYQAGELDFAGQPRPGRARLLGWVRHPWRTRRRGPSLLPPRAPGRVEALRADGSGLVLTFDPKPHRVTCEAVVRRVGAAFPSIRASCPDSGARRPASLGAAPTRRPAALPSAASRAAISRQAKKKTPPVTRRGLCRNFQTGSDRRPIEPLRSRTAPGSAHSAGWCSTCPACSCCRSRRTGCLPWSRTPAAA